MATWEVGDLRRPTLTITPADTTTQATLTVIAPNGATSTPNININIVSGVGTATAEAYTLTASGEWVERWVVTGTGSGTEHAVVLVAPSPVDEISARVYATTTDYARYLGDAPPSGSRRALREASSVVDEMLMTAVYDVGTDGKPTNTNVIQAVTLATCAQAEYAHKRGDAHMVGVGRPTQFSIGGVSVSQGEPDSAGAQNLPKHWSPKAWRILRQIPPEFISWQIWS